MGGSQFDLTLETLGHGVLMLTTVFQISCVLIMLPVLTRANLKNHGIVDPQSRYVLGLQVGIEGADTRVQNRVRLRRESLVVENWELALGQMQELSLSSGLAKKPALCLVCGGRDEDKGGRGEDRGRQG